jgi:predicted HAD superfamily hydrolase
MKYTKAVSFDFFGTLCGRRCTNCEDIYELVGETLGISGFREARINAQAKAFISMHSKKKRTINIREIYECLVIEGRSIDEMVGIEEMHELEQSVANQYVCEIYRECVNRTDTLVAITSDMYLGSAFFVACLEKHGMPLPDIMLISCEKDAKKRDDGSLFRLLLKKFAQYGVADVAHIGDDPISDIKNALAHNIAAILYLGPSSIQIDLKSAIYKSTQYIAPNPSNSKARDIPLIGSDIIYSLAVVARQLLEFSLNTSRKATTKSIFFAARDGFILSELWKSLNYDSVHGIRGIYFPCSRAVSIKCGTDPGNFEDFSEQFSSGIEGLLTGWGWIAVQQVS